MQRLTVTLDDELMGEIDRFMATRGYSNRSEALRDLVRAGLTRGIEAIGETRTCRATLTYVMAPETRDLARRLAALYGAWTTLNQVRVQRPLIGGEVLEVVLLEGTTGDVRSLAEAIAAERGVRNGRLILVP